MAFYVLRESELPPHYSYVISTLVPAVLTTVIAKALK
jgi:uncharacterized membrane protein